MQIICIREGRQGFHVGDVVTLPGNPDAFDYSYFAQLPDSETEEVRKRKREDELAEVAKLQQQIAEAEAAQAAKATQPETTPADAQADGE